MKHISAFVSSWIVFCLLVWPVDLYANNAMPTGLVHIKTELNYTTLIERLDAAVKKNKMGFIIIYSYI